MLKKDIRLFAIIILIFSMSLLLIGCDSVGGGSDAAFYLPEGFKTTHPRLPHPGEAYIAQLNQYPIYLKKYLDLADKFNPQNPVSADAVRSLMVAYLATKDASYLEKIKALATSSFPNFWFSKLECLATVYDWAYNDLDDKTKALFQQRLAAETASAINYYKEIQVSPYNDVGYVRLRSAIFLGALSLGNDHPRGGEFLKFAEDVLFNKYLPVWRQLIGEGGGWHEGAEYVNLGIGTMLYSALASWGAATGRDLFDENPWIENFIYYPIYATRPDKTPVRIGDVAWGTYITFPDLLGISEVYDNPYGRWAAYEFERYGKRIPTGFKPTGWPWGKPDESTVEVKPPDDLPLSHHFKGWGVVVMRSDWSEDAVYATFRCGDNFWSHQHFDSGAFTIYKRGALAIDSGYYGAGYDSEHHINYAMQTIAHNCVTVTDPKDYYPRAKRSLPNDGGQRRTGSLYNDAPNDINDWLKNKEDYEMGDILIYDAYDSYTYVVGDITAAYNNSKSGSGDYRHRTKRISDYKRHFLFFRPDIFIVVDYVSVLDKNFMKRWLLHSINEPYINGDTVIITRADNVKHGYSWAPGLKYRNGNQRYYQYNGRLFSKTLFPKEFCIEKIGGPGHEFEINGVNYSKNNSGKSVQPDPLIGPQEPGAWRIEVSPKKASENDIFVHVLYATEAQVEQMPLTLAIEADTMLGVYIESETRKVALFPREIPVTKDVNSVKFSIENKGEPVQCFLFGMKKEKTYSVKKTVNAGSMTVTVELAAEGVSSNANGVLKFDL